MPSFKTNLDLTQDQILNRIKQDIFCSLDRYTRNFPDYITPEYFSYYHKNKKPMLLAAMKDGLSYNRGVLIYIHIPFCISQCVFCCSFPCKSNTSLQKRYIDYLLKEIYLFAELDLLRGNEIRAIYFGGGNPTIIYSESIAKILGCIKKSFTLHTDCNITCETHPAFIVGSKGRELLDKLIECGINRLSMGVQTFDDGILALCKRGHTKEDVWAAIGNTKKYNIFTNVDMMIGLPGQNIATIQNDLRQLEQIKSHAIEYLRHDIVNRKVIRLYKKYPQLLVKKDTLFEMNWLVKKWMETNNFEQNGFFSEKNQFFPYRYYWVNEIPYLAFGSKTRSHLGTICFDNHENLNLYFRLLDEDKLPVSKYRIINLKEQMVRSLLLRLQTKIGLNIQGFNSRFKTNIHKELNNIIEILKSYYLITEEESHIRLTGSFGRYFVEDVSCLIVNTTIRNMELKRSRVFGSREKIAYSPINKLSLAFRIGQGIREINDIIKETLILVSINCTFLLRKLRKLYA